MSTVKQCSNLNTEKFCKSLTEGSGAVTAMLQSSKGRRMRYSTVCIVQSIALILIKLHTVNTQSDCHKCGCSEDLCSRLCCQYLDTASLLQLDLNVDCLQLDISNVTGPSSSATELEQCGGFVLSSSRKHYCLSALPDNLCLFPDIRVITLTGTSLSEFPDLSCLSRLVVLDLSDNKLRSVPQNAAFSGLTMLEEIRLDRNQIISIHPNAFDISLPYLRLFSVTHNQIKSFEPWPFTVYHPFCGFDFSFNQIDILTNSRNFTIDDSLDYGPGWVDLSHNSLSKSPADFLKMFGLFNPLVLWGKFLNWGFDLRENPFHCDCSFYEIAEWLQALKIVMQRDYFNITCVSPPRFKGTAVFDLPLENLTCDVTANCPQNCTCKRRPATKDTSVTCTGSGLSELPPFMPEGDLSLFLNNNSIERVLTREYLARTLHLNLSGNMIQFIEEDAPRSLKSRAESFDLRNNPLRHLPYTFQVLTPVTVFLDNDALSCTCDLAWFPGWVQQSVSPRYDHVYCTAEDGHKVLLRNATQLDLDCITEGDNSAYKLALISVAVVLMVVMLVMVVFRYEALVLTHAVRGRIDRRRLLGRKFSTAGSSPPPHYDLFLSTAANDADMMLWVSEVLLPLLSEHGLTCYWPARDCLPGTVEMEEVTKKLYDSQSALVLVSHDYLASPACLFQFRQAYNRMMQHGQGRLILLLQGAFRRKSITEPRLRAMITLRMVHKNPALSDLKKILSSVRDVRRESFIDNFAVNRI